MLTRIKFGIIAEVGLVCTPNPILDEADDCNCIVSFLNSVQRRGNGLIEKNK